MHVDVDSVLLGAIRMNRWQKRDNSDSEGIKMSSIIEVQGRRLKVEDGDEIWVEKHYCGRCNSEHTKIIVTRNGKEIAELGDDLTVDGKDEVYGGVVVDENGNALPDPHWVLHLLRNDKSCMTPDMYYVGICGKVLNEPDTRVRDRITWITRLNTIPSTLSKEERDRICPECLEKFNAN